MHASAPFDQALCSAAWAPGGDAFAVGGFNCVALCDAAGWVHAKVRLGVAGRLCACLPAGLPACPLRPRVQADRHSAGTIAARAVVAAHPQPRLCQRPQAHAELGSVLRLAWSPDGTQLAAAGGAGVVALGRVVGRRVEGGTAAAQLDDERTIRVADAAGEVKEVLELRDPVVKFSLGERLGWGGVRLGVLAWLPSPRLGRPPPTPSCQPAGYGHLVAATATQCYIYSTANFNTPHIVDLAQPPHLLLQCERCILLVDAAAGMQVRGTTGAGAPGRRRLPGSVAAAGVRGRGARQRQVTHVCPPLTPRRTPQVVTYDGRPVCQPKAPGMRPELLSAAMASIAPDTLAALDAPGASAVRLFDTAQGRQQGEPLQHGVEVRQVALSQVRAGRAPRPAPWPTMQRGASARPRSEQPAQERAARRRGEG